MTPKKQLEKWVAGESIHNQSRDECCPDFSCCNKKMNTDLDVKKRFLKAYLEGDESTQHEMLMMFLGEALSKHNIHIAGDTHELDI